MKFNRNPLKFGKSLEPPTQELVRNTLGLVNASAEDAIRYGGELTRAAMSIMELRNDRKYVVVDTKVHMLMPGFSPAIPGWHTDGVPRGASMSPLARDVPRIDIQNAIELPDRWVAKQYRPTHFHMLVTGSCRTEFLVERNLELEVTENTKLYTDISHQVDEKLMNMKLEEPEAIVRPGDGEVLHFDWWDLHRGIPAPKHEWRFFIRVTEMDLAPPETDLRKVIRTQQQIYAPADFGW